MVMYFLSRSEEPALSSMDISTGHMVLVSIANSINICWTFWWGNWLYEFTGGITLHACYMSTSLFDATPLFWIHQSGAARSHFN